MPHGSQRAWEHSWAEDEPQDGSRQDNWRGQHISGTSGGKVEHLAKGRAKGSKGWSREGMCNPNLGAVTVKDGQRYLLDCS